MPLRFVLASAFLFLVPVFGLTSCSKDKPSDDWSMSEPTVVGTNVSLKVSASGDRTLPPDSRLSFSGAPWSVMHVHSDCTSGNRHAQDDFAFGYRETLDLRSLWPREMIAKLTTQQLEQSSCDLQFSARNEHGSTQDFEIAQARISRFASDKAAFTLFKHDGAVWTSLNIKASARTKPFSLEDDGSTLQETSEALVQEVGAEAKLALICGDKSAEADDTNAQALVTKLALADVQRCHLLASRRTDTNEFAMSGEFALRFSRSKLNVHADFDYTASPGSADGLKITIENTSDQDAEFSVPKSAPNFVFHVVAYDSVAYRIPGFSISPIEMVAPTSVRVDGAKLTEASAEIQTFALAPHSAVAVSLLSYAYSACNQFAMASEVIVGVKFGAESAFEIRQDEKVIYAAPIWSNAITSTSAVAQRMQPQLGASVPSSVPVAAAASRINQCL